MRNSNVKGILFTVVWIVIKIAANQNIPFAEYADFLIDNWNMVQPVYGSACSHLPLIWNSIKQRVTHMFLR